MDSLKIVDIRSKLPTHSTRRYKRRPLNVIKMIVIHNSGAENQNANIYASYHVNSRGWPGIGYHYVIDRDGIINWCNDLENASYHASNSNYISIGICLSGDLVKNQASPEQIKSAYRLISFLMDTVPSITQILGHKETPGSNTDCPGINMNNFRKGYDEYADNIAKETNTQKKSIPLVDKYKEPAQWMFDTLNYCAENKLINNPEIWKDAILEPMPVWAVLSLMKTIHSTFIKYSGGGQR